MSKLPVGLLVVVLGCGGSKKHSAGPEVAPGEPPPDWVVQVELSEDKLCGSGVAGAGFDEFSPYPKQLSQERAVRNLAGILGTNVQEAIFDTVNTWNGQSVEL